MRGLRLWLALTLALLLVSRPAIKLVRALEEEEEGFNELFNEGDEEGDGLDSFPEDEGIEDGDDFEGLDGEGEDEGAEDEIPEGDDGDVVALNKETLAEKVAAGKPFLLEVIAEACVYVSLLCAAEEDELILPFPPLLSTLVPTLCLLCCVSPPPPPPSPPPSPLTTACPILPLLLFSHLCCAMLSVCALLPPPPFSAQNLLTPSPPFQETFTHQALCRAVVSCGVPPVLCAVVRALQVAGPRVQGGRRRAEAV